MSVNIMDLVKGAVSNQVMGQIGGLLGTDAKKTPSLFETAAGSILGGLMKKGSTSQGAQDIFGAVQKQDDSVLDKLGDLLGGGDATDQFQKQGGGILDLVTGGSQQSTGMIGMVAKALGMDKGIVGKLLMMAAPILMGVIGKHVKNKALDAVGLGNLLGEQKSHLSGFMPASLTNDLGFGNMLGAAGDMAGSAANAVGNAGNAALGAAGNVGNAAMGAAGNVGNAAMGAAGSVGDAAMGAAGNVGGAARDVAGAATGGAGGLLKFLIPLGVLGALAFWGIPKLMDMNSRETAPIDGSSITAPAVPNLAEMDFGSIPNMDALGDTGPMLTNSLSDLTNGLKEVTDEVGAEAYATKLTGFTDKLGDFGLDSMEGAGKTAVSGIFGKFVESMKGLLAGKSEGVQGILKPVIDTLMQKLSPFTGM